MAVNEYHLFEPIKITVTKLVNIIHFGSSELKFVFFFLQTSSSVSLARTLFDHDLIVRTDRAAFA